MPKFDQVAGKPLWLPLARIIALEAGPGGLTSVITFLTSQAPGLEQSEVEGTVASHAEILDYLETGRRAEDAQGLVKA